MTKALAVEGWLVAKPVREEKPNNRVLRVRKGKTLRLTTKPGGQNQENRSG